MREIETCQSADLVVNVILTEAEEEILTAELSPEPTLIDGASNIIPRHTTSTTSESQGVLLPAFPPLPWGGGHRHTLCSA